MLQSLWGRFLEVIPRSNISKKKNKKMKVLRVELTSHTVVMKDMFQKVIQILVGFL